MINERQQDKYIYMELLSSHSYTSFLFMKGPGRDCGSELIAQGRREKSLPFTLFYSSSLYSKLQLSNNPFTGFINLNNSLEFSVAISAVPVISLTSVSFLL